MRQCGMRAVVLGWLLISGLALGSHSQQQPVTATRSIASANVQAGGSFQVEVTIQPNSGVISGMAFQESLPAGWNVSEQTSTPAATFNSRDNTWLWLARIEDQVAVQYTVKVASNAASGAFDIRGVVISANPSFQLPVGGDSRVTVTGGGSGEDHSIAQALDVNQNNFLDDPEILAAIQAWIAGKPIEGAGGQTIDDREILRLIDLWVRGAPIEP